MAIKSDVSSRSSDSVGAKVPARKKPLAERVIQLGLGAAGVALPSVAAKAAFSIFCHPRRHPPRGPELACLASANVSSLETATGPLKTYTWEPTGNDGAEPPLTVLLLHGWEGRAGQMGTIGIALANRGFRAVALEAPGHGSSEGPYYPSLFQIADALRVGAEKYGPVHAVVAHSAGTLCLIRALSDGLAVKHVIAISAVSSLDKLLLQFVDRLRLSREMENRIRGLAMARFGQTLWRDLNAFELLGRDLPRALFVHDRGDPDMEFEESVLISQAWPGAELKLTEGLGHRRILADAEVVEHCVRFLAPGN